MHNATKIVLILLFVITSMVLAEYPAGYFYFIFREDTFCVYPVITDSVIESEWFDYGSASLHTGLEVPFESHSFFFYNPYSGNIGFVVQHNIDVYGTSNATCSLYIDNLPTGTSLAISDDAHEFNLSRYPQGQWHWWYNTDGGAIYIPRDEWQYRAIYTYGGIDPIHRFCFLSGDEGEETIYLDTVHVGEFDTLYLGHGFLQILPYPSDSIWHDITSIERDTVIDVLIRNSGETIDTLYVNGANHSNPLFSTISTPGMMLPSDGGMIKINFAGGPIGLYIDTIWANTNEPCGTQPIILYVNVIPPAIGYIMVKGESVPMFLRVIDTIYAEDMRSGMLMVKLMDTIGAADLVDTTTTNSSNIFIQTPYGIRAWRKSISMH